LWGQNAFAMVGLDSLYFVVRYDFNILLISLTAASFIITWSLHCAYLYTKMMRSLWLRSSSTLLADYCCFNRLINESQTQKYQFSKTGDSNHPLINKKPTALQILFALSSSV